MGPKYTWRIIIAAFGVVILAWGLIRVILNHPTSLIGSSDVAISLIGFTIILIALFADRHSPPTP
jgi:hypothetical protein